MATQHTASIKIPISPEANQLAQSFASEQAKVWKAKQVFRNTLAVLGVYGYLQLLQIDSDLDSSASWQAELRALFDTGDLFVPGYGHLDCRPLDPEETEFSRPDPLEKTCRGYVAVRLLSRILEAEMIPVIEEVELIGFIKASRVADEAERISVAQLESLEVLLDDISLVESWEELVRASDPTVLQLQQVLGERKIEFLDLLDTLIRQDQDLTERDHQAARFLLPLVNGTRSRQRDQPGESAPQPDIDGWGEQDVFDLLDQLWQKLGLD